jgi:hypothetical protein
MLERGREVKRPLLLYSVVAGPYSFLSVSPDVARIGGEELKKYYADHPDATKEDMAKEHSRIQKRLCNMNFEGLTKVKLV